MDTFRLTLIFLGLAVLFIIYLLETQRRRKLKQSQRDRQREPSLDGNGTEHSDNADDMPDDVPDMPANLNVDNFRAQPSAAHGGEGLGRDSGRDGPGDSEDMIAGTPIGAGILGRETLGSPRYSAPAPAADSSLGDPLPEAEPFPAIPATPRPPSAAPAMAAPSPNPAPNPVPANTAIPTSPVSTPNTGAPPTPPDLPQTPEFAETAVPQPEEADKVPEPPEGMPELIIALKLSAPDDGNFNGRELQEALRHCDMEYGPMQIYHYYTPRRRTLFYLANALEPGSFDLTSMASLNTPQVLFFLRLPTVLSGREAFDIMLKTARAVCDRLNGILRNQQGATLGKHELIMIREQIAEYEYKLKQHRREM